MPRSDNIEPLQSSLAGACTGKARPWQVPDRAARLQAQPLYAVDGWFLTSGSPASSAMRWRYWRSSTRSFRPAASRSLCLRAHPNRFMITCASSCTAG